MKRILWIPIALWSAVIAVGQTSSSYINDGIVTFPPQVDATNFINNGSFYITNSFVTSPYYTYNTLSFSNRNLMQSTVGFRFDNSPSGSGLSKPAANFVNANLVNGVTAKIFGEQKLLIQATNVVNKGLLEVGFDGLLSMEGRGVDLTRGTVKMDGFEPTNAPYFFGGGIFVGFFGQPVGLFDEYWGVGTQSGFGNFSLPTPQSPFYIATNLVDGLYNFTVANLALSNSVTVSTFEDHPNARETTYQVVFLSNTNSLIDTGVGFLPDDIIVRWSNVITDAITGTAYTNTLYLLDEFAGTTNLFVIPNFSASAYAPNPTYQPVNYFFTRVDPGFSFFSPSNIPFSAALLQQNSRASYATYGVSLAPVTTLAFTNVPGASVTNLPGRIEITANSQLNLNRTRIDALNYLSLKTTNHFVGSPNAYITAPYSDINLTSTNGSLALANVLRPTLPRFSGNIHLWSARWTNFITINNETFTNRYHVLLVDSKFATESPAYVNNLKLRSTNTLAPGSLTDIYISDIMNIQQSLLLQSDRLTINPGGALHILSPEITWTPSLPYLKYFTNNGILTSYNSVYFAGARRPPFFSGSFDEPYETFVNHSNIQTASAQIWANYFENTGTNLTVNGPLSLTCISGVVTGGVTQTTFGGVSDVSFSGNLLSISNAYVPSGRKLSFTVTNKLSDGLLTWTSGASASNIFVCNDGFDLTVKPALGDLLGTIVTNIAFPGVQVVNTWAGENRGLSTSGFTNNVAIGRLVLDGGVDSQFTFRGAGEANAIYVDYLELKNNATNFFETNAFFSALDIEPNMVIYFANANIPPEKLQTRPDGRLRWVSSFTGPNSSVVISYPSGQVYTFNSALVGSCTLDSDGDGLPNCQDQTPVYTSDNLGFSVSFNSQSNSLGFTWNALANATNFIEFKTNLSSSNWTVLTNFVSGSSNGPVTLPISKGANSSLFYRLRIAPIAP